MESASLYRYAYDENQHIFNYFDDVQDWGENICLCILLGSFWSITPIDEIQSHPDNHVVTDFKYE